MVTLQTSEDQLKQHREIMRKERERYQQAEREKALLREKLEQLRKQRQYRDA